MKFSKNKQFVIQVQRNCEPYFNSEKLLSTTMFGWFHPSFFASWVVPAFMYRSTYFSVYTVSNFDHNFTLFISFPLLSAMKIVTSSFLSGIIPVKEKKSHIYNFDMIFKHFFFPSTFPLPIQSQNMSKLTWRSLPIIHNYTKYRKIPKISPLAYIFQRSFLRGLFLKGLIHGGAYFRNFTVSNVYISVACLAGV